MKYQVLDLGTMVTDSITNRKGMLTHMVFYMGGNIDYIFQPYGINPTTGKPVDVMWFGEARVIGGKRIVVDVPIDLFGKEGEDEASGFKGKVMGFTYHINGCVHVSLKPETVLKSTGANVESQDFDIRRVKIKGVKSLKDKELKEDLQKKPSPIDVGRVIR